MKTLNRLGLIGATLLLFVSTAQADPKSHRKAAEDLLRTMNVERQMQAAIDQTLDAQVKANPVVALYRDVMKRFLTKHMAWDSLKDEIIAIYADAFSEEELREINQFYQTPVGRKVVEKTPELVGKGMQLGARRVQMNQAELQQMIQDEINKKQ
jgi:uncharacterized protein